MTQVSVFSVQFSYLSFMTPACHAEAQQSVGGTAETLRSGPLGPDSLADKSSFIPGKAAGLRIIQAICLPKAVKAGALWRD
jgi:hypothetical protein